MERATESVEMMELEERGRQGEMQMAATTAGNSGQGGRTKASVGGKEESFLEKAKMGMEKLRRKLSGKWLFKDSEDGSVRIGVGEGERKANETVIRLEELVGGEGEEVEVEICEKEKEEAESTGSVKSVGTNVDGYNFLDDIEESKGEELWERRREENKKRKVEETKKTLKVKGLKLTPGWEERANEIMPSPWQWEGSLGRQWRKEAIRRM